MKFIAVDQNKFTLIGLEEALKQLKLDIYTLQSFEGINYHIADIAPTFLLFDVETLLASNFISEIQKIDFSKYNLYLLVSDEAQELTAIEMLNVSLPKNQIITKPINLSKFVKEFTVIKD